MTDHRMDGWARRLARADEEMIASASGRNTANGGQLFDGVARTLAAPVTRRRAVGLIGGAAVAASLLRPRRARADCYPGGPQTCTASGGQKVCVPADYVCCNNDKCAIACRSYQACEGPGICGDTAKLCNTARGREDGGISDAFRTRFCSAVLPKTGSRTCGQPDSIRATFGWCCRPNDDCVLLRDSYGSCKCPEDDQGRGPRDCGEQCCPRGQICVTTGNFISSEQHCKPACVHGRHYDRDGNCVCDSGSTCGLNGCCPEGKVCQRNRCVSPTEPSGPFKDFFNSFRGFFGGDSGGQSAGSSAGGNYLRIGHRRIPTGRAAAGPGSTPVRSALLLLAAVNAQGAAAALAINDPTADHSFRRRVVVAKPKLPKLAGGGLPPGAASALDALLGAEAKAFAQIFATATALARSRGALHARNASQARKQALAAGKLAAAAAKTLRGIPTLRSKAAAALRAGGVAEVTVAITDMSELQNAVQTTGLPGDLTSLLKGLGMTGADLKSVRTLYQGLAPADAPVLIAPLADQARNRSLTQLASALSAYSRQVRRSPIKRTRVERLKVKGPRA